jgi:hypothetical protein
MTKDTLMLEEWTKKKQISAVYKTRKEEFLRRRLSYTVAWHIYIVYIAVVVYFVPFYSMSGPTPEG